MINAYKKINNYDEVKEKLFLSAKKGEAINMGKLVDILWEEGMAEGIEKGIEKGKVVGGNQKIYELVQEGIITVEQGADNLNISCEQLEANMINMGYSLPE